MRRPSLLLSFALGCGLGPGALPGETGFAELSCEPQAIDFRAVEPGACGRAVLSCRTAGPGRALFLSAQIGGNSSPDFAVVSWPGETELSTPEDSVEVALAYCPETLGDDVGVAILSFAERDVQIPLQGSGGGPNIVVQPHALNFGLTSLLGPSTRTLLISNVGFAPLTVTARIEDDLEGVFGLPEPPTAAIAPGDAWALQIDFLPVAEQVYEANLIIESDDPSFPENRVRLRTL
ncbi:MAG: hypothetical protein AAGD10_20070 [Myxococcota bacterium]